MAALGALAALLLAGCSKPPEVILQRLSPEAPAAAGLPPSPVGEEPTPLVDRPPFGLYAIYPDRDTLTSLSIGTLSPDNRFRAALTAQGLWVTRKDGAWLWQVPLPGEANAPSLIGPTAQTGAPAGQTVPTVQTTQAATPAQPGKPAPPPPPKSTKYVGPLRWTSQNTLLMRDEMGTWVTCNPETAMVTVLPQALQGKEELLFSPDGKLVIFFIPTKAGRELWMSNADGSKPKYLGVNVTGAWDPKGQPVVQKATTPAPGTLTPTDLAPDLRVGPGRQ
jgi:hypothetical protein